jgi:hypothetical protein
VVELVRDISKERRGDARILKRDDALLVYDLLNPACEVLERLEVLVLCKHGNSGVIFWVSIPPSLVDFVYPVNWACRVRQYAVV